MVQTWLSEIGLETAWTSFEAAGIVTPSALTQLDASHFAALGVQTPEDRRKLFFLVQRIKMEPQQSNIFSTVTSVSSSQRESDIDLVAAVPVQSQCRDDATDQQGRRQATRVSPFKENHKPSEAAYTKTLCTVTTTAGTSPRRAPPIHISSSSHRGLGASLSPRSIPTTVLSSPRQHATTPESFVSAVQHHNHNYENFVDDDDEFFDSFLADDDDQSIENKSSLEDSDYKDESVDTMDLPQRRQSRRLLEKQQATGARSRQTNGPSSTKGGRPTNGPITSMRNKKIDASSNHSSAPKLIKSASEILEDAINGDLVQVTAAVADFKKTTLVGRKSGLAVPSHRPSASSDATLSLRHNPGKSMRTGKQLSSIPAGIVPPMSPLIDLKVGVQGETPLGGRTTARSRRRSSSLDGVVKRQLAMSRGRQADDDTDNDSVSSHHSLGSKSASERSLGRQSRLSCGSSDRSVGSTTQSSGGNRRSILTGRSSSADQSRRSSIGAERRRPQQQGPHHSGGSTTAAAGSLGTSKSHSFGAMAQHQPSRFHRNGVQLSSWKNMIEELRLDNASEYELFGGTEPLTNQHCTANDEEMRIRVVVRKRPMSVSEIAAAGDVDVIHPLDYGTYGRVLVYQPKTRVDLTKQIETVPFAFDNAFDCTVSNSEIYERSIRNLIPSLFEGQWASIFAYGQTGSGVS